MPSKTEMESIKRSEKLRKKKQREKEQVEAKQRDRTKQVKLL